MYVCVGALAPRCFAMPRFALRAKARKEGEPIIHFNLPTHPLPPKPQHKGDRPRQGDGHTPTHPRSSTNPPNPYTFPFSLLSLAPTHHTQT